MTLKSVGRGSPQIRASWTTIALRPVSVDSVPKSPAEGCDDVSWLSAVPDVLVCVGLFFVPGLLATYLGGLRGITAWATAPLVTVAVVAAVAVLGGLFGFRFGVWPAVAGTVAMALLAAGLAMLLRARGLKQPAPDPARYSLAVVIGAAAAVVIGSVTFITGVKRPDAISETYDAIFHYNAIRYIEQTGKASPLTIGSLGQPSSHGSFYPDAWHTMAALLAELTGASIPVAATVTCLVIAVVVWPAACLLLARHLFGAIGSRAVAAVVITGMLSSLFGAFPWMLTGAWGVLWPNALGMALAPAGVALGLSITRISAGDTFGAQRWLFGVAGAWAIGIAHPNSALSVAVICLLPVLMCVGPYVLDQWNRNTVGTTLVLLALLAVVVVGAYVALGLHVVRHTESQYFPVTQTAGQAVASAVSNGTDGQVAEWAMAAFLIIGVVACFVWRQRRWLVIAELIIVALYVASAAIASNVVRPFTGLWYNDSHRLAATLPIVAIPLTTIGVLAAGEWLLQALHRLPSAASLAARPALVLALPVALGTVVAVGTAAQAVPDNAKTVGAQFSTSGANTFVSAAKLQFLQTVARLVPASALVADDPFEGTAYLYSLSGTHVLFPQAGTGSDNIELTYLAQHLVRLGKDPMACALVRQYGIGYMIVGPDDYLAKDQLPGFYGGVADPGRDPGFRLLAADGPLRLYKITTCQPTSQPGPAVAASRSSG
jgi:hypothetical protein